MKEKQIRRFLRNVRLDSDDELETLYVFLSREAKRQEKLSHEAHEASIEYSCKAALAKLLLEQRREK